MEGKTSIMMATLQNNNPQDNSKKIEIHINMIDTLPETNSKRPR